MLKTSPAIERFINVESLLLALLITIILIWIIAIITIIRARSVRQNSKTVVSEYDPPKDISPVFARFIMVSGREGGMAGEVSKTGAQLLTLINMYEDGLLKRLRMIDDITVEYEIHENFQNMECAEEEKKFLERLSKEIGMSGRLQETENPKSQVDGYLNLNMLWFHFWHEDLYQLALSRGYMIKQSRSSFILDIFSTSLLFGVFVSFFCNFDSDNRCNHRRGSSLAYSSGLLNRIWNSKYCLNVYRFFLGFE